MDAPACSIQRLAELQTPDRGRHEAGGGWRAVSGRMQAVGGVCCIVGGRQHIFAEIMILANMVV